MPTTDEKRLINMVVERFHDSESARQPWADMWLRCYRLYRGYRDPLPEGEEDRANLHIPKVFAHIETIVPRIVAATLSRRPWVAVKPREPGDELGADMNQKLFEYQAERQDLFSKLVGYYKEALIYGTAVAKIPWRYETKTRRVLERQDFQIALPGGAVLNLSRLFRLEPVYVEVEKEIVVWDDPWFEHIDLFDFYPDPDGKSIEDMKWCIHRSFASLEELKGAGIYSNLDEVQELGAYSGDRGIDLRLSEIGRGGGRTSDKRSRPIEILEYWEDDRVVAIANRAVVIRDEENPYWHMQKPFIAMRDTPVPHEFYGIGTVEPIRYLQEEKNARRNQRMDNVTLALQRMFIASRNAEINPADLKWRPGGVIWVSSENISEAIQPITIPDVTASSVQEELMIDRDMDDATGASEFARGHMPTRGATATEIEQLAMATSARVDLKVRLMAYEGLRQIARHWVALNQQFMRQPRAIRITGRNEWITVRPEDIAGEYDFIPAAANVESFANRDKIRSDIIQVLGLSANPVDSQIIDRRELWKRFLELSDVGDPESLLISPQPPAAPPAAGSTPAVGPVPAEPAAPAGEAALSGGAPLVAAG